MRVSRSVSTLRLAMVAMVAMCCLTTVLAASLDAPLPQERKFVSKPNDIKKIKKTIEKKTHPVSVQQNTGFEWGNMMGMAMKMLIGGPRDGASDKADTITKLAMSATSGELTWTKMLSLLMEVVLSFVGGEDNNSIDREGQAPTPIQNVLSAFIAYLTDSKDPDEINVLARQASQLLGLGVNMLDAVRTSFSQRSLEARSLGSSDPMADAAVAATSMVKSYVRTYNTEDDICMQKYLCEANNECVTGSSDTGYLFCQMGTYGLSYVLERSTYTPFEIYNDAGRKGRVGEDCGRLFPDCNEI